jgi:excisionase family DNA binding protein
MKRRPLIQGLTRPKQEVLSAIELLYVADVARLLSCSEKAIRRRIERGLLPHRRLGGRVIFLRSEIEAFLAMLPGVTLDEARANLALRSGEEVAR